MLNRREAVKALLAGREDAAIVTGLGSPTYDVASLGEHPRNYYLWGAMGSAVMTGLGIALAKPDLSVIVITGDGELLMGLGSLATVAVKAPKNLAIVVLDNGRYGETGMQTSHTSATCDLVSVARACGIREVCDVSNHRSLDHARQTLLRRDVTRFLRVAISADEAPRVMPSRDAVEIKLRFRSAVLGAST